MIIKPPKNTGKLDLNELGHRILYPNTILIIPHDHLTFFLPNVMLYIYGY